MKFSVMQVSVMAGKLGDIFWDLAPAISYTAGYDIGCTIYVANTTNVEKGYALIARLTSGSQMLSEEALPVYGQTWFKVDPGDVAVLKGALRFNNSNAVLTVSLIEEETQAETDSVATTLIAPTGTTAALPPAWPGTTTTTTTDWTSMLTSMMPMLMFMMLGMMMVSSLKPSGEKPREERR